MQSLTPSLVTAPATALITLDEAKRQVRRDDDDDNAVITSLIAVVMSRLDGPDGILGRALIAQEWSESFDGFPVGSVLPLSLAPVIDITGIEYFDFQNGEQAFAGGNFAAFNRAKQAYVRLNSTAAWPSSYDRDDAVTVTYRAGYGEAAEDVPAAIKHAGLLLLGHYYENREAALVGTAATSIPEGVMTLLRPFIRPHF